MPRDSKYYQGRFHPQNPKKYQGDVKNIIYRSSWELKFMKWCDTNDSILEYSSEEFFIPYFDPTTKKVRRYFPDFCVKYISSSGEIKKAVVEIKPLRETKEPVVTKNKRKKTLLNETLTYAKNQAKWKAADEWCKDHMMEFKIITERELSL